MATYLVATYPQVRGFQNIRGWGAELNREIVSRRACVRAVCMSSELGAKIYGRGLSLFPFRRGRFSLFPSPAPQSPIQLQLALSVFVGRPWCLLHCAPIEDVCAMSTIQLLFGIPFVNLLAMAREG